MKASEKKSQCRADVFVLNRVPKRSRRSIQAEM